MKRDEFIPIAADLQARWWQFPIPPSALDQFASDLADLPASKVAAAIAVHAASDNDRPPTAGQVRRRVAELELDAPSWEEVRTAFVRWLQGGDRRAQLIEAWTCPHSACDGSGKILHETENQSWDCECKPARDVVRRGLGELPPLAAEFVTEQHVATAEIAAFLRDGDRTAEAQVRDRWRMFVERAIASRTLSGLPDSDLARIEAARTEDLARRGRAHGQLRRFRPLAALGQGESDAAA